MSSYWGSEKINSTPNDLANVEHLDFEYFVIDDFLSDPESVREEMLGLNFETPPNPKKGVISFNSAIPETITSEIQPKIQKALNKTVQFHPRSKIAATYEHVPLNNVCHVDGGDGMTMFNWTVIIYMNTPEQCRGGTRIFKHKETGDIYNRLGWSHYAGDSFDVDKWELVEEVEMKFNRALLLPAWLFHSLAYTFGDEINNARLTINPKIVAI